MFVQSTFKPFSIKSSQYSHVRQADIPPDVFSTKHEVLPVEVVVLTQNGPAGNLLHA
jgi:hypothetical protein